MSLPLVPMFKVERVGDDCVWTDYYIGGPNTVKDVGIGADPARKVLIVIPGMFASLIPIEIKTLMFIGNMQITFQFNSPSSIPPVILTHDDIGDVVCREFRLSQNGPNNLGYNVLAVGCNNYGD
jgi:hypothetical protein